MLCRPDLAAPPAPATATADAARLAVGPPPACAAPSLSPRARVGHAVVHTGLHGHQRISVHTGHGGLPAAEAGLLLSAASAVERPALIVPSEADERRARGQPSVLCVLGASKNLFPPKNTGDKAQSADDGADESMDEGLGCAAAAAHGSRTNESSVVAHADDALAEENESAQKSRRLKGRGAKRRRDEKREREGISVAQPARVAARETLLPPALRLVPPPRPPPGPPPPWSVPVPHMPPPFAPPAQSQSHHLTWINPAAPPRPPPRTAAYPRAAQHPLARAQQSASNAVAAASRATAGAQAIALCAVEIAAIATRIAAKRPTPPSDREVVPPTHAPGRDGRTCPRP